MVGLEKLLLCKSIVILCITCMVADGQPTNCISALNLDNSTATAEDIYVFITPGARVVQGTELYLLCCFYSPHTGLSPPSWRFNPEDNGDSFAKSSVVSDLPNNGPSLLQISLNATARLSINNTEAICYSNRFSNTIRINVLGPPPPPTLVLEVIAESLIVRWDPVFSSLEYPVTEYTLSVSRSTGELLHTRTMTNLTTFVEVYPNVTNGEECEEFVFSVSATNELGEGEGGNIMGGFPKANGLTSSDLAVQAIVLFNLELQAQVQLSLKKPSLCPYQTLNYTIFVNGEIDGTDQIREISVSSKMSDLADVVTHHVPSLSLQSHYAVHASLATDGEENIKTKFTNFNTTVQFPCSTNGFLSVTIVYALSVVCVLLACCIGLCLCAFGIKYCRLCCMSRKRISRREMVNNPIYSGPIYDSVYDARGRLLTSNASTPSSVGAPDFPPPPNGNVKQLESSLMAQSFVESHPSEPRYSTYTQSDIVADTYVKMRGKMDSNGSNGADVASLGTMMDLDEDLVKVSDV